MSFTQITWPGYGWIRLDFDSRGATKKGKNYPGKISAKSDNWFKSYGQKVSYQRLGTGIQYPDLTRVIGI